MKLLGDENGIISIKGLLNQKFSNLKVQPDLAFEDIFKTFVEESKLVTLQEAKILFKTILDI